MTRYGLSVAMPSLFGRLSVARCLPRVPSRCRDAVTVAGIDKELARSSKHKPLAAAS